MFGKIVFFVLMLVMAVPGLAQDNGAEPVSVQANDGLALVGDIYFPAQSAGHDPAVVLLHMLGRDRSTYQPLIPYLLEAGYVVLNVDMRGHGETGGAVDWPLAEADIQVWFDWLREQDRVDAESVSVIGASIGGNLALMGCANDAGCLTAVALSPGLDYRGVQPEEAVTQGLAQRSALLVASHGDDFSARSVIQLFGSAPGSISARLYIGRAHGTALFDDELESISRVIINWLDEQRNAAANQESGL